MAKNTRNAQFRKINVDQFGDDVYRDPEQDETGESAGLRNESEVNQLMLSNNRVGAFHALIEQLPLDTKEQSKKDHAFQLLMQVMLSVKSNDIEKAVTSLSENKIDTLMKYIYRGFENPSEGSSALLLTWFEKAYAVGGLGSIVRVLTDRKRV